MPEDLVPSEEYVLPPHIRMLGKVVTGVYVSCGVVIDAVGAAEIASGSAHEGLNNIFTGNALVGIGGLVAFAWTWKKQPQQNSE